MIGVLANAALCAASACQEPILDPTTWCSPSGEFELAVAPSAADGRGPGSYSLVRAGTTVWEGEKPFTLWRAALTDEGVAIGFAYTEGIRSAKGELQAIRIGSTGVVTVCAAALRNPPWGPDGAPWPVGRDILLQPETDQAVIRMLGKERVESWYLKISTGETLPTFRIDDERKAWHRPRAAERSAGPDASSEPPSIQLRMLPSLAADRPPRLAGDVRDVHGFDIDDRGRFGWVRSSLDARAWELVLVDEEGDRVAEVALGDLGRNEQGERSLRPNTVWTSGNRWVVTMEVREKPTHSLAWFVDVLSGEVTPVEGLRFQQVWDLAAMPDGGFTVLENRRGEFTSETTVTTFDSEGTPSWTVGATLDPADHTRMFAPANLAVTSEGRIVVLDNVRDILQVFDRRGTPLTWIGLRNVWGLDPAYLRGLADDAEGGLLIAESEESKRIHRIGRGGEILSTIRPQAADGRMLPGWPIVRAPDGRFWTCEGDSLLRLGEDGRVDLELGDPVRPDRLGDVLGVEMDAEGRMYVLDWSSRVVHVFGPDGRPLHRSEPIPTDFPPSMGPTDLSIGPDGTVYQELREKRSRGTPIRFLAFDRGGRRIGWVSLGLDWITEKWRFKPSGGERWVLGYRELFLVAADGSLKRTIARQPDGRWLRSPQDAACAPDGSVALLTAPFHSSQETERAVHLYDPDGEPLRSFPMPSDVRTYHPALAWSGQWLVVARRDGRFLLVDTTTGDRRSFRPDGLGTDRSLDPFLAAGGRELLLVEKRSLIDHRYSLPSD